VGGVGRSVTGPAAARAVQSVPAKRRVHEIERCYPTNMAWHLRVETGRPGLPTARIGRRVPCWNW
jgi:hypothetical protein